MNQSPPAHERRQATTPTAPPHFYRVYGLTIASQLELPELQPIPAPVAPDVEIRCTTVPDELEGATHHASWLQTTADECLFRVEGIASFRIKHGRVIELDRRVLNTTGAGRCVGDVRVYLLGTALGTLIHQRAWLPLHISAVDTPSGVWAFTGPSGAGKSTTAALLHYRQGWPLVSDDVAVIKPDNPEPILYPGPPRLKLCKDVLDLLGIPEADLTRDFTLSEKYHLQMHDGYIEQPHRLAALVLLEQVEHGQSPVLEQIHDGLEKFQVSMSTLYRPNIGIHFQSAGSLMLACAQLANHLRVFRYRRPLAAEGLETDLQPLIREINRGFL